MGLDIYFHKTQTIKTGYFRKVNFLVKYFSDKYDLENCRPVEITVDDIKELIFYMQYLSDIESESISKFTTLSEKTKLSILSYI